MSDAPETPTDAAVDRRHWLAMAVALLGYAAVFVAFWPPMPGIMDEVGFINQAEAWSRGAISAEGAGMDTYSFAQAKGRHVPYRHPGVSVLLLPIVAVTDSMPALFILGLVIHLAITFVAAKLFVHWRFSPLWALLVLFHPTLLLFSRTAMADGTATLMILIAFLAAQRVPRPHLLMGLALGFATACRMQIVLMVFGAGVWLLWRREFLGAIVFGLGAAAFGVPLAIYNFVLFGTLTGMKFAEGFISPVHVVDKLPFDLVYLSIVWPLMLPLALLHWKLPLKTLWLLLVLPFMGLMACYHHRDTAPSALQTLIVWPRLLQPVIPLLIAAYVHVLGHLKIGKRWPGMAMAVVVMIGGLGANVFIFKKHQEHLNTLLAARRTICHAFPSNSRLFMNTNAAKLVSVVDQECRGFRTIVADDSHPQRGLEEYFATPVDGVAWYTKAGMGDVPESVVKDLASKGFVEAPAVPGMRLWKKP